VEQLTTKNVSFLPKFNEAGLVPAIAQDVVTGRVLMMAWMNLEAWERTLSTNQAWYFSRSRQALWRKGETSGHTQTVVECRLDCDRDTVLLLVEQVGAACHVGEPTCFFRELGSEEHQVPAPPSALARLRAELGTRVGASADESYTARLLQKGVEAIASKLREEAEELCEALGDEADDRVVSECADLLYFSLVGLTDRGIAWEAVERELYRRFGTSGLVEKASRGRSNDS
jgi:phosphoribosyl-ATP pyrophosphohydrolase/phosphoribosyl-AMP cyclohydrolase